MAEPLITMNPFVLVQNQGLAAQTTGQALDFTLVGRADGKAELEGLLRLECVVAHAVALRVVRENQTERHVQHRHEEQNFEAVGRLEVLEGEARARLDDRRDRSAVRYE